MAAKITNSMVQSLTLKESLKLRESLDNHISELQKAQQAEVLEKVNNMLDEVGLSVDDLKPQKKTRKSPGTVAPKYKSPDGTLYSGRGRKPVVFQKLLDEGHSMEEYLIDKD